MSYPRSITEGGFTLVELLAALVIAGVVFGAVTTNFRSQSRTYDVQGQVNEMQLIARTAIDMMAREIRMAGFNPSGATFVAVTNTSATEIRVRADLDGDGAIGGDYEDIIYAFNSITLSIDKTATVSSTTSTDAITENIQALAIAYLDSTGTATTTPADIRQIEISVTARTPRVDPGYSLNGGRRTYTLTSLITPRNLAL
jgi:type IV pilus assembly protein PilW